MASDGADAALAEVQRLFAGGLTAAHSAGVRCYYCGAGGHHILLCRRLEADRESYVAHLRKRSEAKVAEGSGPVLGVREYLQTHAAFLSEAEVLSCPCTRTMPPFALLLVWRKCTGEVYRN